MATKTAQSHLVVTQRIQTDYVATTGASSDEEAIRMALDGKGVTIKAPWTPTTRVSAKKIPEGISMEQLKSKIVKRPAAKKK